MGIRLADGRVLDDDQMSFSFVRSSGPGGQNVNKVSTAAELRFDAASSAVLTAEEKLRLLALAGRKATRAGIILIDARNHRTREANRKEAIRRLAELIDRALEKPRERVETAPTAASREIRLRQKRRRGAAKAGRGNPAREEYGSPDEDPEPPSQGPDG